MNTNDILAAIERAVRDLAKSDDPPVGRYVNSRGHVLTVTGSIAPENRRSARVIGNDQYGPQEWTPLAWRRSTYSPAGLADFDGHAFRHCLAREVERGTCLGNALRGRGDVHFLVLGAWPSRPKDEYHADLGAVPGLLERLVADLGPHLLGDLIALAARCARLMA